MRWEHQSFSHFKVSVNHREGLVEMHSGSMGEAGNLLVPPRVAPWITAARLSGVLTVTGAYED